MIAIVIRVDRDRVACLHQGPGAVVGLKRNLGREPLKLWVSRGEAVCLQLPDQLVGLIVTAAVEKKLDCPADDIGSKHPQFDRP